MCDERTDADNQKYLRANKLTRRQFGAVSAGASLAFLLPRAANAQAVTEALHEVGEEDMVVITGSLYVVSDARDRLVTD